MMTGSQNDLVTRVENGAAAGTLLRSYWQPIALTLELSEKRPLLPVRFFGRDFVLFRTRDGYGLLDRHCPHRGADLAFGRLEPDGLRCTFHGWKFDRRGACLETPAEPEGSRLCARIRQPSYPVIARSGTVFAYLGDGPPPAFPPIDCLVAPGAHTFAFKGLFECNWLQALEVGIDPSHASYLHRFFDDEEATDDSNVQFRANSANSDVPVTRILRDFSRPAIEFEATRYGLQIETTRHIRDEIRHVRVTNLFFPNAFIIPMSPTVTITQWHVPVDDVNTYWFAIFTSYDAPLDKRAMYEERIALYPPPHYRALRNRSNDYLFDPDEQQRSTFTGMGQDVNAHDQWAVESQGLIQDRSREHLGTADKCIVAYRKLLIRSIRDMATGTAPMMACGDLSDLPRPATIDIVVPESGWRKNWRTLEARRREQAIWTNVSP